MGRRITAEPMDEISAQWIKKYNAREKVKDAIVGLIAIMGLIAIVVGMRLGIFW